MKIVYLNNGFLYVVIGQKLLYNSKKFKIAEL